LIQIDVPGRSTLELQHLVLDLNGTVALDGEPITGVGDRVAALSAHLVVHLATADTHGQAEETSRRLGCQLVRIEPRHEASQKGALVERLGAAHVVAIGNGANDARMLSAAAVGIAILGPEGLAVETLRAADLVVGCIEDALDLLLYPQRIMATLRR
jgi:P-type E1-E2 ATPase